MELNLTREQADALIAFTEGHPYGVSLEEGAFGPGYVTAKLFDEENNVIDARTWTWAGQSPRPDTLPPDWKDKDAEE
jgi:hypothetical protein